MAWALNLVFKSVSLKIILHPQWWWWWWGGGVGGGVGWGGWVGGWVWGVWGWGCGGVGAFFYQITFQFNVLTL